MQTFQLLRAVTIDSYGWRHHPAAKMWRGYVPALTKYGLEVVDAWIRLGHDDSVRPQLLCFAPEVDSLPQQSLELPSFIGDEVSYLSHRSNLVRKNPEFYRQVFGDVPDDRPYVWPDPTR